MEVKLHHHAMPVVMVLGALFVLSFLAVAQVSDSFNHAAKGLVSRNLTISPQKNVLAKVESVTQEPEATVPAGASQAGSRAQFTFNLR
jgi:hypothetical protein